ncbi:MAG: hypothetical protein WCD89_27495 [Anaerocolumna sp.]
MIGFFCSQTHSELVMFFYFLSMLIFMIILFALKGRDKNIINKKKFLFQAITFIITMAFIIISSLVSDMMQPVFWYQIAIGITSLIIYTLCINNLNISKVAGIEFGESSETYKQLITYSELADKVSACMTDFTSIITSDIINQLKYCNNEDLTKIWAYAINSYIKTGKLLEINFYFELSPDILKNYITNIVSEKKLWYNKSEINEFVNDIQNNKVVKLQTTLYLIPVDDVLIYIKSKRSFEKVDVEFIINTFRTINLLKIS